MHSSTDPAFRQARAIKKGEHALPAHHKALLDWIGEQLGVQPLDFELEARTTSTGFRQQIVNVNVERVAHAELLDKPDARRAIAGRFREYFNGGHDAAGDKTKTSAHSVVDGVFPEIAVGFSALETIEAKLANEKVDTSAIERVFAKKIHSITTNNGVDHTVWFKSDEQWEQARQGGLVDEITGAFVEALKRHDEFGWFGPHSVSVTFDSRENLDKNFGGQEWMYYR